MFGADIFWLLILLAVSAFFSASETAFMAVNRYRINHKARQGSERDQRIVDELKNPDSLLSVILFANTVANFLIASLSTLVFIHFFGEDGMVLTSIFAAFILLILAELLPKNFAASYPEKFIYLSVAVIRPLRYLLTPIVVAMKWINGFLLSVIGNVKVRSIDGQPLTKDELKGVLRMSRASLSSWHHDMISDVLNLDDLIVNDIMVHRNDIVAIDISARWDSLQKRIAGAKSHHVLLYRRTLDQFVGVASIKRLYQLMVSGSLNRNTFMQSLEPVEYIPEGTSVKHQLQRFKKSKTQLGIVVDEYGLVMGLVTMSDIIDEIIRGFTGEDELNMQVKHIDEGVYEAVGQLPIRDFNRLTNGSLPTNGPVTLSGLVIEVLETIPSGAVCVEIDGYVIEVIEIVDQRVERMKIISEAGFVDRKEGGEVS